MEEDPKKMKPSTAATGQDYSVKQKHPRVQTRIEIPYWKYVKLNKKGSVDIGFVKNISKGGFFIETEQIFDKGTEIAFEFYTSNSSKPVAGVAKVVWSRKPHEDEDPSNPPGMGLEFQSFEGESQVILDQFIEAELEMQKKS